MSEASEISSNEDFQDDGDRSGVDNTPSAHSTISSFTSDPYRISSRIYVGNLKNLVTRDDLITIFQKYGKIEACSTQKGQYGFVQFESEEPAGKATLGERGLLFKGCLLHVRRCTQNDHPRMKPPFPMGEEYPPRSRRRSNSPPGQYPGDRGGPPRGRYGRFSPPRGGREMSPQRHRSPPRYRSPPHGGPYRDRRGSPSRSRPRMEDPRKPNDCEIIVVHKQQREYAEMIERRLKNLGLQVDLLFLKDEAVLGQALEDLAIRGTLYAVVVSQQHEVHNSITLNILQGLAQEHRNMPLDDALKLISRNFREHMEKQRENGGDAQEREIKFLLKLLIEGRYVSIPELDRIILHLQERRDRLLASERGEGGQQRPLPIVPKEADLVAAIAKAAVEAQQQSQHQQLQQKILSMISQPAQPVVTASTTPTAVAPALFPIQNTSVSAVPTVTTTTQPSTVATKPTFLNFDNPSVQQALDKLMNSGSNILKAVGQPFTSAHSQQPVSSASMVTTTSAMSSSAGTTNMYGQQNNYPLMKTAPEPRDLAIVIDDDMMQGQAAPPPPQERSQAQPPAPYGSEYSQGYNVSYDYNQPSYEEGYEHRPGMDNSRHSYNSPPDGRKDIRPGRGGGRDAGRSAPPPPPPEEPYLNEGYGGYGEEGYYDDPAAYGVDNNGYDPYSGMSYGDEYYQQQGYQEHYQPPPAKRGRGGDSSRGRGGDPSRGRGGGPLRGRGGGLPRGRGRGSRGSGNKAGYY